MADLSIITLRNLTGSKSADTVRWLRSDKFFVKQLKGIQNTGSFGTHQNPLFN